MLDSIDGDASFQPNDTYLALSSSFHVITGPNMSGKSTYLRQVGGELGFHIIPFKRVSALAWEPA